MVLLWIGFAVVRAQPEVIGDVYNMTSKPGKTLPGCAEGLPQLAFSENTGVVVWHGKEKINENTVIYGGERAKNIYALIYKINDLAISYDDDSLSKINIGLHNVRRPMIAYKDNQYVILWRDQVPGTVLWRWFGKVCNRTLSCRNEESYNENIKLKRNYKIEEQLVAVTAAFDQPDLAFAAAWSDCDHDSCIIFTRSFKHDHTAIPGGSVFVADVKGFKPGNLAIASLAKLDRHAVMYLNKGSTGEALNLQIYETPSDGTVPHDGTIAVTTDNQTAIAGLPALVRVGDGLMVCYQKGKSIVGQRYNSNGDETGEGPVDLVVNDKPYYFAIVPWQKKGFAAFWSKGSFVSDKAVAAVSHDGNGWTDKGDFKMGKPIGQEGLNCLSTEEQTIICTWRSSEQSEFCDYRGVIQAFRWSLKPTAPPPGDRQTNPVFWFFLAVGVCAIACLGGVADARDED